MAADNTKFIGELLRSALTAQGMTVKELSEKSGLQRTLIQAYLSNQKSPRNLNITKIANALEISPFYFTQSDLSRSASDDNFHILINEIEKDYAVTPEDQKELYYDLFNTYWLNFKSEFNRKIIERKKQKLQEELAQPTTEDQVQNWNLSKYLIMMEDDTFSLIFDLCSLIKDKKYEESLLLLENIPIILDRRNNNNYIPTHFLSEEAKTIYSIRKEKIIELYTYLVGIQKQQFECLGRIIINLGKDDQFILNDYIDNLKIILAMSK